MSRYTKPAAIKRRALEKAAAVGLKNATRVSASLVNACDLAVERCIHQAIAQHQWTAKTLKAPAHGIPARKTRMV